MADTALLPIKSKASWMGFVVDATLSEGAEHTWELTESPIEDGSPTTDHIIERPDVVTLTQVVSDHPGDGTDRVGRAREAYDKLLLFGRLRQPADLVTGFRLYKNMAMKSLSVPRTPQNSESFIFTAIFQTIRTATALVTTIPPSAPKPGTAQARTPPTANVGPQTPVEADASTSTSTLQDIADTASAIIRGG